MNYIIFHNIFTGALKVFYYSEVPMPTSNVIWKLNFSSPQKFLYDSDKISIERSAVFKPSCALNEIYLSNITESSSKGISLGWNCFQASLAYDPDFTSNFMGIHPVNIDNWTFTLSGDLQAKTEGVVISQVNTSNGLLSKLGQGLVKLVGNKAKEWFEGIFNIGTRSIQSSNTTSNFLSNYTSRGERGGEKQTVELTTDGKITMTGDIQSAAQTGIAGDVSIPINLTDVGALGNWILERPVILWVRPLLEYDTEGQLTGGNEYPYRLTDKYEISKSEVHVLINPEIKKYIDSYSTSVDIYYMCPQYGRGNELDYIQYDFGTAENQYTLGSGLAMEDLDKDGRREPLFEAKGADGKWISYYVPTFNHTYTFWLPTETPPQFMSAIGMTAMQGPFEIFNYYIAKVTVTFNTNINGVKKQIVTKKTFRPQINWGGE